MLYILIYQKLYIAAYRLQIAHEVCFLIPNNKGKDAQVLVELGKEISRKYNQELFLFQEDENFEFHFIRKSGDIESNFTSSNLNEIVQIYFSKISHRTFTEVYVKCGAETINEHHARTLRGEIQIVEYGS